jgi:hypothetical protein
VSFFDVGAKVLSSSGPPQCEKSFIPIWHFVRTRSFEAARLPC